MRKSYTVEILVFILAAIAGALISKLTILTFLGGFVIILLTSYFIIPELKSHTIKEYRDALTSKTRNTEEQHGNNDN